MISITGLHAAKRYLETSISNMELLIHNPNLEDYRQRIKYYPLPRFYFESIGNQEQLKQFNEISKLLGLYNNCEQKLLEVKASSEMIGKRVIKKTRKPFKGGDTVNTVSNIIVHPYKPGWSLAYTFEEDDSCVSVEQVREYCGN